MTTNNNRQQKTLTGFLEKKLVNKGTKSEHKGCVLTTDNGEKYRIRYTDENPFEQGHTSTFVGKKVEIIGFELENSKLFIYTEIKEVESL